MSRALTTALLVGTLAGAEASAESLEWRSEATAHFVFRFTEPDARSAAFLVELAEGAKARIDADLGLDDPTPILVEIAPDWATYEALQPRGWRPPRWSVAVAHPNDDRIILLSGRRTREVGLDATFRHEYAHLALARIAGGRPLPAWLHEGFAIYHSGEWTLERATRVTRQVLGGRVPGLADLTRFTSFDPREAETAYTLSFHFIAYLHRTYGPEGFRRFISALAAGAEPTEALEAMSGGYWRRVERDWRHTLTVRYGYVPAGAVGAAAWAFGGGALWLGWLRRRRRDRAILAQWAREEEALDRESAALAGGEPGPDADLPDDPGSANGGKP